MRQLRYPSRALFGDYLRSAAGLCVGLGVLLAVPPSAPVLAIFGTLAVLFAVFGLRTVHRHSLRVAVTDDAIACRGALVKVIRWSEIDAMKLRYFGSRRSRWRPSGSGFMQLVLKGPGKERRTTMAFESSLEGFDWLAGRAAAAMRARGQALDPTSASNLIELGIDPDDPGGEAPSGGCHPPPNVL